MDEEREFIADLLAGRRTHIDEGGQRGPGDDPRGTDELLDDVRESLDELEATRSADPAGALALLRSLLGDDSLDQDDLGSFIEVWRTAISSPDVFKQNVERDVGDVRGPREWWNRLRGYLHRPRAPDAEQQTILDGMAALYRFPRHDLAPPVNPNERLFEVPDPAWVPLLKAKLAERKWPEGLVPMRRHKPPQTYTYLAASADGAPLAADEVHDVALFSDFGTGSYHAWGIAEQLAAWALPYSFHLGDVYYAGRPGEFLRRFDVPLFDVVESTQLLGLAENHELYEGGGEYLRYFETLKERGRTPQEGSYFCVRFPHHQIIGLDVNWQGRCRFRPEDTAAHEWLRARLSEAGQRTNILLTGNAPFVHGHERAKPLLEDLWPHVRDGAIGLWFWGDDHYCALFDRKSPEVPFYGSCIGHGGFPGPRQQEMRKTFATEPLWLEDQPRFPEWTHLRDDVTNNGWCQATLRPDGGVDLLYVDWLWCRRAAISFDRAGPGLRAAGDPQVFERDTSPQIHSP